MAKRTRKKRKQSQRVRLSPAQLVQPAQDRQQLDPKPVPRVAAKALPELHKEYHYVATDLKRIAIIAVVMLAVMISLAVLLV